MTCAVKDCTFDDATHEAGAWCRHIPDTVHAEGYQHQHWPKRSQGGKEIVALLCPFCHDRVDNYPGWSNAVIEVLGRRYYRMWDLNNNTLIERELNVTGTGDHAEEAGAVLPALHEDGANADAPVQGHAQTRDEELDEGHTGSAVIVRRDLPVYGTVLSDSVRSDNAGAGDSLDDWVYRGQQLREALETQQKGMVATAFSVGEWVNEGEGRFGENASQFIDMFSYWKVNRWARLARLIPPENREFGNATNITLEHFRAVADEPPDEQRRLLQAAVDTGQSAADMKRRDDSEQAVKPRCWTLEELRAAVAAYHESADYGEDVPDAFIDYLAEQGG